MYRPCYYDLKHELVITQKEINQELYSFESTNSFVYFNTKIEALICRELRVLQRELIGKQCHYQMAIKKRATFEYLPGYNFYHSEIYRFAFALEFYHHRDILARMNRNTWGIKLNPGDSFWESRFNRLFIETLNDIAQDSSCKKLISETLYIDYMKDRETRLEQTRCFHYSLLNEILRYRLLGKTLVVIEKDLKWYEVPFPTTDLNNIKTAVFDMFTSNSGHF